MRRCRTSPRSPRRGSQSRNRTGRASRGALAGLGLASLDRPAAVPQRVCSVGARCRPARLRRRCLQDVAASSGTCKLCARMNGARLQLRPRLPHSAGAGGESLAWLTLLGACQPPKSLPSFIPNHPAPQGMPNHLPHPIFSLLPCLLLTPAHCLYLSTRRSCRPLACPMRSPTAVTCASCSSRPRTSTSTSGGCRVSGGGRGGSAVGWVRLLCPTQWWGRVVGGGRQPGTGNPGL